MERQIGRRVRFERLRIDARRQERQGLQEERGAAGRADWLAGPAAGPATGGNRRPGGREGQHGPGRREGRARQGRRKGRQGQEGHTVGRASTARAARRPSRAPLPRQGPGRLRRPVTPVTQVRRRPCHATTPAPRLSRRRPGRARSRAKARRRTAGSQGASRQQRQRPRRDADRAGGRVEPGEQRTRRHGLRRLAGGAARRRLRRRVCAHAQEDTPKLNAKGREGLAAFPPRRSPRAMAWQPVISRTSRTAPSEPSAASGAWSGWGLLALGLLLIAEATVTVLWQEPFTALSTRGEQKKLAAELDRHARRSRARPGRTASRSRRGRSSGALRRAIRSGGS